jgi:hypothetical protein
MKKLILLTLTLNLFSQFGLADTFVRSGVKEYIRFGTANAEPYELQTISDRNQENEKAVFNSAVKDLEAGCSRRQKLDIANINFSPDGVSAQLDQKITLQIFGVCRDPQARDVNF